MGALCLSLREREREGGMKTEEEEEEEERHKGREREGELIMSLHPENVPETSLTPHPRLISKMVDDNLLTSLERSPLFTVTPYFQTPNI